MAVNLDGQTLTDEEIEMDGGSFKGATLLRCVLSYSGGEFPDLLDATMDQCRWQFRGAAARSLGMLAIIRVYDSAQAEDLLAAAQRQINRDLRHTH